MMAKIPQMGFSECGQDSLRKLVQERMTLIEIIIALRIIMGDTGQYCWGGLSCRSCECRNRVFWDGS